MPIVRFRGCILPSALRINFSGGLPLISKEVATGDTLRISVTVVDSLVTVEVGVDHYTAGDDISIIHTRATHVARALLDCFAFINGFGLIVFLDQIEDGDGIFKRIRLEQKELSVPVTAFKNRDGSFDFDAMCRLVVTDPDLSLALNDLIVAIAIPGHIAINCARSIEALRYILVPDESKRKQGWEELRRVLRLDESYTKFVTMSSSGPRHGAGRYLPTEEVQQETMRRAWVIMNRFLEYRKRGSQPLPLNEFPLLN